MVPAAVKGHVMVSGGADKTGFRRSPSCLGSYHQPRSPACHAVREYWPRYRKGKRMNEVRHSLDRLAAATERLLASAAALSDAQLREPSPLPGWTRGHVVSHVEGSDEGLRNLLAWAGTGSEAHNYAGSR